MGRGLSEQFIKDLKSGLNTKLGALLSFVRNDDTLDMEIRENSLNIYYRGGSILEVIENKGDYKFDFSLNSYLPENDKESRITFSKYIREYKWNSFFPLAKQAIDFYFTKEKSSEEREFQQLFIRENNYSSIAKSTDYFVIDIEYANKELGARFDIVAVEWQSKASHRKLQKNLKPKLVVIEMKYGEDALKGGSGIRKHYNDFQKLKNNTKKLNEFKAEMISVFSQKRALHLIPDLSVAGNANEVKEFADKIDLIFLIANHDPESKRLKNELNSVNDENVKFITSNFMGYGLYKQNVFSLSEFLNRFSKQIYEVEKSQK